MQAAKFSLDSIVERLEELASYMRCGEPMSSDEQLDSLDLIDLTSKAERYFGVEISNKEYQEMKMSCIKPTIFEVAKFFERKINVR